VIFHLPFYNRSNCPKKYPTNHADETMMPTFEVRKHVQDWLRMNLYTLASIPNVTMPLLQRLVGLIVAAAGAVGSAAYIG
jgi:hypothetical protein